MSQTLHKVSSSIRSIFKPLTLFILVVLYLLLGNVVDYLYGAKVSQSLVLSGPFHLFILAVVTLSLLTNVIRKLILKNFSWINGLIHFGLIGLFGTSLISNLDGHYKSMHGVLKLSEGVQSNTALLDQYEISIINRNTKEKIFVDINYSLRPQGLNLDFGPTYLLSYLPFSQRTYNLRDAHGEVSAVIEVVDQATGLSQKTLLSTNNYDYENFSVINGQEIFLYDQEKLSCMLDLSNVNPSCIGMLRRRTLSELKSELCQSGNYLITKSGFISLADSCRLNELRGRLIIDGKAITLVKYYTDKQIEEDYHYKRDLKLKDSDVIKYYEKQSPKRVRFIKPGKNFEIVDIAGDFHDMHFQHKKTALPFYIKLLELNDKHVSIEIAEQKLELKEATAFHHLDYNVRFDRYLPESKQAVFNITKDPLRQVKIGFFTLFCIGFVFFVLTLFKGRTED